MTIRRLPRVAGSCAIGVPLIQKASPAELLQLRTAGADFCELRLDLAHCNSPAEALRIGQSLASLPLLATYRSKAEGGKGDDAQQGRALLAAVMPVASAIDLELSAPDLYTELAPALQQHGCELISSVHFTQYTPSLAQLRTCVKRGVESGASIVKIATKVTSEENIATLLELFIEPSETGCELAVMGMGDLHLAASSRIRCARAGSVFTFAQHALASAPGQPKLDWLSAQLRGECDEASMLSPS